MAYGISIRDKNSVDYILSNTMNSFFYRKEVFNLKAGDIPQKIFVQTDIPLDCPMNLFFKLDRSNTNEAVAVTSIWNWFADPVGQKWGIQLVGSSPVTKDVVITVYVFIPMYVGKFKKGYGLTVYEGDRVVFSMSRPLLDIESFYDSINSFDMNTQKISSNVAVKTFNFVPAISYTYVGRMSPVRNWYDMYYYQAVGKEVSLKYFHHTDPFSQSAISMNKINTISVIDSTAYDGFNNLTWDQVVTRGI